MNTALHSRAFKQIPIRQTNESGGFSSALCFFRAVPTRSFATLEDGVGEDGGNAKSPLGVQISTNKNKPDTTKVVSGLLELVERFELSAY